VELEAASFELQAASLDLRRKGFVNTCSESMLFTTRIKIIRQ
jgi:hypothetical protein